MISASGWLFKKKSITMHGNMNINFLSCSKICDWTNKTWKLSFSSGSVHCKREIFFSSPRLALLLDPPSPRFNGAVPPKTEWSKFEV